MKHILLIFLFSSALSVSGQDTTALRMDTDTTTVKFGSFFKPSDSTNFQILYGTGFAFNPCAYLTIPCSEGPFRCAICKRQLKKGEAFIYIVLETSKERTSADYGHLRCAMKRIK